MARRAMKVLSVASECAPLVKTGGLADVVGALPAALAPEGVAMRVLLPGYPAVMTAAGAATPVADLPDLFGGDGRLLGAQAAGLDLLILDAPHLYDRPGSIYLGPDGADWPDNPARFAALAWVAAAIGRGEVGAWRPDVLHLHDWQAGLAPEYAPGVPTVLTIHNVAFHGLFPPQMMTALRLDSRHYDADGFEFWGRGSALKAGIVGADRLTTVSPTYAAELMRPEFGMGLDGVLRSRSDKLTGILNGIDTTVWDPSADLHLHATYSDPTGKPVARDALRSELGLPVSQGPLCVVVSRLTEQKGLDLLLQALPALLEAGGQLALLGSGDAALEADWKLAGRQTGVSVRIGYDEPLSHRMIAGGDAILVPSRFEPCGLTQLYGLRYGTIPVVGYTGGLADTVIHASPAALTAGVATGLHIHPIDLDSTAAALRRLCALHADRPTWSRLVTNAMASRVDWGPSAVAYASLYRELAPVP